MKTLLTEFIYNGNRNERKKKTTKQTNTNIYIANQLEMESSRIRRCLLIYTS